MHCKKQWRNTESEMEYMYDFYKYNEKYIEGYLGEPENFNGIVFLLKEPNNPDGAKEFWFKSMLDSTEKYLKETKNSRSIFTKFKNRFSEMIEYTDNNKELKNAIFCNVNPIYGKSKATNDFYEILTSGKPEKMLEFFSSLKDIITVFTCKDIYRHLLKSDKIKVLKETSGLRYKNKNEPLGCFECEIRSTKVVVYEILHPSRSGKIQE